MKKTIIVMLTLIVISSVFVNFSMRSKKIDASEFNRVSKTTLEEKLGKAAKSKVWYENNTQLTTLNYNLEEYNLEFILEKGKVIKLNIFFVDDQVFKSPKNLFKEYGFSCKNYNTIKTSSNIKRYIVNNIEVFIPSCKNNKYKFIKITY